MQKSQSQTSIPSSSTVQTSPPMATRPAAVLVARSVFEVLMSQVPSEPVATTKRLKALEKAIKTTGEAALSASMLTHKALLESVGASSPDQLDAILSQIHTELRRLVKKTFREPIVEPTTEPTPMTASLPQSPEARSVSETPLTDEPSFNVVATEGFGKTRTAIVNSPRVIPNMINTSSSQDLIGTTAMHSKSASVPTQVSDPVKKKAAPVKAKVEAAPVTAEAPIVPTPAPVKKKAAPVTEAPIVSVPVKKKAAPVTEAPIVSTTAPVKKAAPVKAKVVVETPAVSTPAPIKKKAAPVEKKAAQVVADKSFQLPSGATIVLIPASVKKKAAPVKKKAAPVKAKVEAAPVTAEAPIVPAPAPVKKKAAPVKADAADAAKKIATIKDALYEAYLLKVVSGENGPTKGKIKPVTADATIVPAPAPVKKAIVAAKAILDALSPEEKATRAAKIKATYAAEKATRATKAKFVTAPVTEAPIAPVKKKAAPVKAKVEAAPVKAKVEAAPVKAEAHIVPTPAPVKKKAAPVKVEIDALIQSTTEVGK